MKRIVSREVYESKEFKVWDRETPSPNVPSCKGLAGSNNLVVDEDEMNEHDGWTHVRVEWPDPHDMLKLIASAIEEVRLLKDDAARYRALRDSTQDWSRYHTSGDGPVVWRLWDPVDDHRGEHFNTLDELADHLKQD